MEVDLEREVARQKRHLEYLEGESRALKKLLAQIAQGKDPSEIAVEHIQDTVWSCNKCGNTLGFYDEKLDVLRMRSREHFIHLHLGKDGWMRHPCRHCGELNEVHEVTVEEVEPEAQQVVS